MTISHILRSQNRAPFPAGSSAAPLGSRCIDREPQRGPLAGAARLNPAAHTVDAERAALDLPQLRELPAATAIPISSRGLPLPTQHVQQAETALGPPPPILGTSAGLVPEPWEAVVVHREPSGRAAEASAAAPARLLGDFSEAGGPAQSPHLETQAPQPAAALMAAVSPETAHAEAGSQKELVLALKARPGLAGAVSADLPSAEPPTAAGLATPAAHAEVGSQTGVPPALQAPPGLGDPMSDDVVPTQPLPVGPPAARNTEAESQTELPPAVEALSGLADGVSPGVSAGVLVGVPPAAAPAAERAQAGSQAGASLGDAQNSATQTLPSEVLESACQTEQMSQEGLAEAMVRCWA